MLAKFHPNAIAAEACACSDLFVGTLGEMVRAWRETKGMSQSALGARVGVDGQTISNLEGGRTRSLKLKHLRKLAEVMGKPIEELTAAVPGRAAGGTVKVAFPRDDYDALAALAAAKGQTVAEYVARLTVRRLPVRGINRTTAPAEPGTPPHPPHGAEQAVGP